MSWQYPFNFSSEDEPEIAGDVYLDPPISYAGSGESLGAVRNGKVVLNNGKTVAFRLYHNPYTEAFFYLSEVSLSDQMREFFGLSGEQLQPGQNILLPGQFIIGSRRTQLIYNAMLGLIEAPFWRDLISAASFDEVVAFPIIREGAKFGITDAIFNLYDWIVEEVMVDAHHVYDSNVPGYGRRTEITVFRDKDLSDSQRKAMKTAVVGDSIASGTVLISVVEALRERYENLSQIEVIAPFTALRGLARLAGCVEEEKSIRVHAFESLLNALVPDYYWSAHYEAPEFHFDPELEQRYRAWWGQDAAGNWIADTACAGYGWSEAFFNPRKHLRMIEGQLMERHGISIPEIITRSMAFAE